MGRDQHWQYLNTQASSYIDKKKKYTLNVTAEAKIIGSAKSMTSIWVNGASR